jgi:hypothetical protein
MKTLHFIQQNFAWIIFYIFLGRILLFIFEWGGYLDVVEKKDNSSIFDPEIKFPHPSPALPF